MLALIVCSASFAESPSGSDVGGGVMSLCGLPTVLQGGGEGDEDHGGAVCDANDAPSPPLLTPGPERGNTCEDLVVLWRRGRRAGG